MDSRQCIKVQINASERRIVSSNDHWGPGNVCERVADPWRTWQPSEYGKNAVSASQDFDGFLQRGDLLSLKCDRPRRLVNQQGGVPPVALASGRRDHRFYLQVPTALRPRRVNNAQGTKGRATEIGVRSAGITQPLIVIKDLG